MSCETCGDVYPAKLRCKACNLRPRTRKYVYEPSPEKIAEVCAAIQSGWTHNDRWQRQFGRVHPGPGGRRAPNKAGKDNLYEYPNPIILDAPSSMQGDMIHAQKIRRHA